MIADRIIAWSLAFALALFPTLALAQSAVLPGFPPGVFQTFVTPGAGGPAGPPVLTYIARNTGPSYASSTYTYASASIGTASGFTARRIIMVFLQASGQFVSPTVTVNGSITATVHCLGQSVLGDPQVMVASADVPTGTTASIAVDGSPNNFSSPVLETYTVDDALLVSTTPSCGTNGINSGATITTSSFTQSAGGFVVAGTQLDAGPTGLTITGYTTDDLGGTNSGVAASLRSIGSSGSATATAAWTNAADAAIAAAAWR